MKSLHRTLCLGLALALVAACSKEPPAAHVAESASPAAAVTTLDIVDLQPGSGAAIAPGQTAVVQYTGWLYEASAADKKGKEFDSSKNGGQPFRFGVGAGQVIKGWDEGILGMKVGGRRRLTIPPDLAYGDAGANGVIPPGAALVFDIDLVGIE